MNQCQLQAVETWFKNYVKGFYSADPAIQAGIELKESHTLRVRDHVARIGRSLDLEVGDLRLAESIALLHDVGRFSQFVRYRTFNDRRSLNHALLGLQEIQRAGVLSNVTEEQRHVIFKAIELHNLAVLPKALEDRLLLFARLIRDADKLDIIGLFVADYGGDHHHSSLLDSGLPDTLGYSPALVENLFQCRSCIYEDLKNRNDRKLLQLSWIYDLNFAYTIAEFARNNYVQKIIDSLPDTEEIRKVSEHLMTYMASRLVSGNQSSPFCKQAST